MNIPLAPVLFGLLPLGHLLRRWRNGDAGKALDELGLRVCSRQYLGWSLGLLVPFTVLFWGAVQFVPPAVIRDPNVSVALSSTTHLSLAAVSSTVLYQVVLVTFPEELFFRGYLGGFLLRRYRFVVGNTVQALVFGLFHSPLVLVDRRLGALVVVQVLVGWLLGWLRYRSESILPGWVMHALSNVLLPVLTGL
ncbi:CPBP family intramembrane glutamic endopeptidase [Halococcus salsus]|uniref:CPBP family intramembrane glutamic endopeptidase n=1 Tax=Halococcus salsus TaxID=2162894 RepID=UPI001358778F|nr:CPBP family intramembrane glutamic endopeptidase [Halococcus salsus]